MKTSPLTRRNGFTLIELLIVITIIAILAGLSVAVAIIMMKKGNEAKARATVHGLAVAIKRYQDEYNQLPNPNSTSSTVDTTIVTDSSNEMIAVLLGKNTTYNQRDIPFYEPPTAKNEASGLIITGGKYEVVDPWSKPSARQYYRITLDYSGDRLIKNPVKTTAPASGVAFSAAYLAAEQTDLSTAVVVYSENDPRSSASRKPITSW